MLNADDNCEPPSLMFLYLLVRPAHYSSMLVGVTFNSGDDSPFIVESIPGRFTSLFSLVSNTWVPIAKATTLS